MYEYTKADVNERDRLMKLLLLGSVIGIVALYIVSQNITSPPVNINEALSMANGNVILVNGIVSGVQLHEDGHIFFTLNDDTGSVKVVLWKDVVKQLELNHVNIDEIKNGDRLEITGTIELYRGELELVPLRAQIKFV
jgi:DNA/RNA endonuclease YhcR with UshA esterase domain